MTAPMDAAPPADAAEAPPAAPLGTVHGAGPLPPSCSAGVAELRAADAPGGGAAPPNACLVLSDGTALQGISFGAAGRSVSGECVFQTGASLSFSLFPPTAACQAPFS
jgi:hypothetical protein